MPQQLSLPRPDDWHVHLRDGAAMRDVVAHTASVFGRALCMPNLKPPVRTVAEAQAYRQRILSALPEGSGFVPLMTLYLTDSTDPDEIEEAANTPWICGVKLYPAGATTNSDAGVTDLAKVDAVLERMAKTGLPLLVHGELTGDHVDIFDREHLFLQTVLTPLMQRHDRLRVVLEHVTTRQGVEFVLSYPKERVAGTITAHHLLLNRNAIFDKGIRPHHYCLPILKREQHRQALVQAATRGDHRFFLGTDSAPHSRGRKEAACGCAGLFTAAQALPLYAEVFEAVGALQHLAAFASEAGPRFYGLAVSDETITLVKEPRRVPMSYDFAGEEVVPFRSGGEVGWTVVTDG
ncbi:MAG: dihydroorotase [Kiritimatiellia bacterium]|jgi:dihydroorotase